MKQIMMNKKLVADVLLHQHLGQSTLALQKKRKLSHWHMNKIADNTHNST
jgi:hypothetical protein